MNALCLPTETQTREHRVVGRQRTNIKRSCRGLIYSTIRESVRSNWRSQQKRELWYTRPRWDSSRASYAKKSEVWGLRHYAPPQVSPEACVAGTAPPKPLLSHIRNSSVYNEISLLNPSWWRLRSRYATNSCVAEQALATEFIVVGQRLAYYSTQYKHHHQFPERKKSSFYELQYFDRGLGWCNG